MEDMGNYGYTLFRTIPLQKAEKAAKSKKKRIAKGQKKADTPMCVRNILAPSLPHKGKHCAVISLLAACCG